MVVICSSPYPQSNEAKYAEYFGWFPYELSDFQKYSIEATVEGHHSLITAHTGSGKSLPAEFAILFFVAQGKRVIYTSPIKALSNQKYYEFTQKYPHISFGIMTGDIKINPDADVVIMTTELLLDNITDRVAAVVFDEIHYINDVDRGHVWERAIMGLPKNIQMIMLSATIDAPEKFAVWAGATTFPPAPPFLTANEGAGNQDAKKVFLSSTSHQIVPLVHYGFLSANDGSIKKMKDKVAQKLIQDTTGKFIPLKSATGTFGDAGYLEIKRAKEVMDDNRMFSARQQVLNQLALQLRDREMLPAIAFVFSRKNVELFAKEITVPLLEFDSKVAYTVRKECEQIVRKLPNHAEYMELPEYHQVVSLLEKGIGIHHSGMVPVLREIVELMISKKYIKLLFATESFAIGLNCPIRTAIFTSLTKFDGKGMRHLLPHEYNQAASRCGRRGIDTIGNVIHCNNLFDLPTASEYKTILCGSPQKLVSKFRISFDLVLKLWNNCPDADEVGRLKYATDFVNNSMIRAEIDASLASEMTVKQNIQTEIDKWRELVRMNKTPPGVCERYNELCHCATTTTNSTRKKVERELSDMRNEHRTIVADAAQLAKLGTLETEMRKCDGYIRYLETYVSSQIQKIGDILRERGFDTTTELGKIAMGIKEVHPLVMSECLAEFNALTPRQIVSVLSCLTDIRVSDDTRLSVPTTNDLMVKSQIERMIGLNSIYWDLERKRETDSGFNYDGAMVFDAVDVMAQWCDLTNELECRVFLSECAIGIGDMTKAILKISAFAREMMSVSPNLELTHKLSQIDGMILKYVATTQSLYI
jgi:superfamily II RNA helicase